MNASPNVPTPDSNGPLIPKPGFVTTHWSVVLAAAGNDTTRAQASLASLCQTYWYPLYAYVRRQGRSKEDAEDLTQAFFAHLLASDFLQSARQEKGRFRAFLLVAFKRFLAHDWERMHAQKRGGGCTLLSLDAEWAEERYRIEPASPVTAEDIYERRWALTLIEQAMQRLRAEFATAGREDEFEALKGALTTDGASIDYARLAAALKQSEGALRVAVHRLRKRFRELFRAQVIETLGPDDDVEAEMRHVIEVLSAPGP